MRQDGYPEARIQIWRSAQAGVPLGGESEVLFDNGVRPEAIRSNLYGKAVLGTHYAGRGLLVLGVYSTGVAIGDSGATSIQIGSPEPLLTESGKQGLVWTFAIGGGKSGAYVGSIGGPLGTAVGGLGGSVVGGTVGATIGDKDHWSQREELRRRQPVDSPYRTYFYGHPGGARP